MFLTIYGRMCAIIVADLGHGMEDGAHDMGGVRCQLFVSFFNHWK